LVDSNDFPVAEYVLCLLAHGAYIAPDQKRKLGKCPDTVVREVLRLRHTTVAHFKHVRI